MKPKHFDNRVFCKDCKWMQTCYGDYCVNPLNDRNPVSGVLIATYCVTKNADCRCTFFEKGEDL